MTTIRAAQDEDNSALWAILEPIFRAGDTYAIPRDISRTDALTFWCGGNHKAYVLEEKGEITATYYICPNQQGGGAHVCNCGFATSPASRGKGHARKLLAHALDTAREQGFTAMQFNFVLSSNFGALKLWAEAGFETVGTLPNAFDHPDLGLIDALVLYKFL